jgi:hypothetical protein
MPTTTNSTSRASEPPFETAVSDVLTRLRAALAEVLAAVPADVTRGADLHHALGIDRKLSWMVFKVAHSPDPVAAGTHVPSRANLNTFFKAAAKRGVPKGRIDAAARIAASFEELVSRHAGDRATFDSMVSAIAHDENSEQINLAHRRLAFRGQKHIYGVQARTKMKFLAVQPNQNPDCVDVASMEGYVSLRRLRGDALVRFAHSGTTNDDGTHRRIERHPLDPGAGADGLALLSEFCSKPLPRFKIVDDIPGKLACELVSTGIGNRAAITCIEGHYVLAGIPRFRDALNTLGNYMVATDCPCEVLTIDLAVRADTMVSFKPVARVCGKIHSTMEPDYDLSHPLPEQHDVVHLGKGPSVLHSPDVPRYPEMARYLFDRMGWDGEAFEIHRCRIEYPVVPATIYVSFDLPERPGGSA